MRKIKVREISREERLSLEKGAKHGATGDFRLRCQAVLLRTETNRAESSASAVAARLGCCVASVNNWLKRYQAQGLAGLQIKKGRGRKPILQQEADLAVVCRVVGRKYPLLSQAKAELEQELGKKFCVVTLKRFLKKTIPAVDRASTG